MGQPLDLDEAFSKWNDDFIGYETEYPNYATSHLKVAFLAAARIVAQDTIDTLRDYATACAGLEKENITPEQIYDRAAKSLTVYYTQVLNKD